MIIAVKCWMKNTDLANSLFLILKMSDMACQLKLKKKKIEYQIFLSFLCLDWIFKNFIFLI